MQAHSASYDAIIVAGGAGQRMGGVSKAELVVDGARLVDTVLRATTSARHVVVVGTVEVPAGVLVTVEDPPGTGPAAGLLAGLRAVPHPSPWSLALSVDLPDAARIVQRLLEARDELGATADGVVIRSQERMQWLMGCYRTPALLGAFAALGNPEHQSLGRALAPLRIVPVSPGSAHPVDVDTPADLVRWQMHRRE